MKPHYKPNVRLAVGDSAWREDGTIDEAGVFVGSVVIGQRWNGWAIPGFTREQVQKVVDYINANSGPDQPTLTWEERDPPKHDAYAAPTRHRLILREPSYEEGEPPYDEDVGPDTDGLYWPGAYSWTWCEVE